MSRTKLAGFKMSGEASLNLNIVNNSYPPIVIARLDRAIQRKELDSPVKPENDRGELTFNCRCSTFIM